MQLSLLHDQVSHLYEISEASTLPREKIREDGIDKLTTSELWSVILGSGSKDIPIKLLSERIEKKISQHKKLSLSDLLQVKGIGLAKACQILAVLEIVERIRPLGYPILDSIGTVLAQVSELRYAQREHVLCLYLNARLQLIHKETLAIGSVNQAVLQPRDVFAVIKHHPISYIIFVHNHPSGTTTPSEEDKEFTQKMWEAGRLLGIELLDHIIVSKREHFSFHEQRLTPFTAKKETN